jgi:hypothetical protein
MKEFFLGLKKLVLALFRMLLVTRWVLWAIGQVPPLVSLFSKFLSTRLGGALVTLFTTPGNHPWCDLAESYQALFKFFGRPALTIAMVFALGETIYEHRDIIMAIGRAVHKLVIIPTFKNVYRRYVRYIGGGEEGCVEISKLKTTTVAGVSITYDERNDMVIAACGGVRRPVESDWVTIEGSPLRFRAITYDENLLNRYRRYV